MSGHPLHGIRPESEKISVRCQWGGTSTPLFKLLVRPPGAKIWEKVGGDSGLASLEKEYRAKGYETLLQRL